MVLTKTMNCGDVRIEIPLDIGDIFYSGSSEYRITKFVVTEYQVFAVNPNIWMDIENLQYTKTIKNTKYFKVIV